MSHAHSGASKEDSQASAASSSLKARDRRRVLTRGEARTVYNNFAKKGHHTAGKDAGGGYGGPAVTALLSMGAFEEASSVFDYGCGQCKLAEVVLGQHPHLRWHGIDQCEEMIKLARERLTSFGETATCEHIPDGDSHEVAASLLPGSFDRFVSTYCLDLMSEDDIFAVIDAAHKALNPDKGVLLLAGITWGYRHSIMTFFTTAVWELLYHFVPHIVGGCRPQTVEPYLKARGWRITRSTLTLPNGFPWMVSEVVAARPPVSES
eukprot:TRINITY_DN46300_c0_g1_i1.p1 TRINITY_DN46300_c0_g1~~TRINITY_DN46300_c0_g1_i1.p1  ORF type:complete len:264 (-),score=28.46 TRINITY_DN46300_c0_g1_i1:93-884(-)